MAECLSVFRYVQFFFFTFRTYLPTYLKYNSHFLLLKCGIQFFFLSIQMKCLKNYTYHKKGSYVITPMELQNNTNNVVLVMGTYPISTTEEILEYTN